ncbi:unnamed protein product [Arabis nemorensis]|uniref:Uncharacterized protein n=1 Tax=Arabis nemorensis TaxID=586526 RepID=A0A565BLE6_9BRAS|nr:unnamed protein product [Arabis nemorensis]
MSGEVARVYRDLVKAVVKHVGKEDHKLHFTDFVNIHAHKDLLFSYNIAVDRTEEMKRVLGKSAASVGIRLPEVYQP